MKILILALGLSLAALPALAAPRDDLLAADRAFSQLSVEKGADFAFWSYTARAGRIYGPSGPPKIGRAPRPPAAAKDTGTLSWSPTAADVSDDGKMGWTDGTWKLSGKDGTVTGHYLTVWVKEDGQWKMQADMGTADPPPGGPRP